MEQTNCQVNWLIDHMGQKQKTILKALQNKNASQTCKRIYKPMLQTHITDNLYRHITDCLAYVGKTRHFGFTPTLNRPKGIMATPKTMDSKGAREQTTTKASLTQGHKD